MNIKEIQKNITYGCGSIIKEIADYALRQYTNVPFIEIFFIFNGSGYMQPKKRKNWIEVNEDFIKSVVPLKEKLSIYNWSDEDFAFNLYCSTEDLKEFSDFAKLYVIGLYAEIAGCEEISEDKVEELENIASYITIQNNRFDVEKSLHAVI